MLSFYWSMKTFILEKKKLCDFFIHFVSLRSNGDNLAPICPFNTGPPVNENSIFYLFWWFGLSPSSFLISPHWLNVLRRCKCPQLAKKVADIPELVNKKWLNSLIDFLSNFWFKNLVLLLLEFVHHLHSETDLNKRLITYE